MMPAVLFLALAAPAWGIRHARRGNRTEAKGLCDPWEVCECTAGWDDSMTTCKRDTCTYTYLPGRPAICCPQGGWYCDDAECKDIDNWGDCEWANWNDDGYGDWNYDRDETPGTNGIYSHVPTVSPPTQTGGFAVISDVDDTMECSGGFPGGADSICLGTEVGEMYPGVAQFQLALARGPRDATSIRKVAPLSARAEELRLFLAMRENSTEDIAYRTAAEAVGIQGWGLDVDNAMYGSLFDLTDIVHLRGTELTRYINFGYRKYKNWKSVGDNWGQGVIFVGDNGQGDAVAAQMMVRRSEGLSDQQGAVRATFIHDVLRRCTSSACRDTWASHGVHLFEHYAHAAGLAAKMGLISQASCQNVCASAPMLPCSC